MGKWRLNRWSLLGSVMWVLSVAHPIAAQVIPDATLPAGERSQVTGNPNVQIDGGARRGGNLFHSFSQFSIPTGGSAYFNNAVDVQNIFSRVTGGSISNIDGLIRANGTANLFLLNPNGILFGPNASLNIGGSFVATTANAIGFPNGEVFSSDATQPLPSQLLTVNPNAFFFNQLTPQPIINRSTFDGMGLQVLPKQNLLLVGGPVQLENGRIASPGTYVEVGSLGGVGTVGLTTTGDDWQLNLPDNVVRADVALINNSRINVLGGDGGSIAIAARNLTITDGSRLRVGIDDGLGFVGAQAGGIRIDATETVNLINSGTMRVEVLPGGTGNVGDITITAGSLVLTRDSRLIADTSGQGNVGSVNINVHDTVSLNGSSVTNIVQTNGIGNAGGVNITARSLSLTSGAQLISLIKGQGDLGSVTINARDTVSLDGNNTAIFNTVEQTGSGNTGGINITTGSLALVRAAALLASTDGQGDAGSVSINARDVVSLDDSAVFNTVGQTGVGNTGGINITTGSLALTRGSQLLASTDGQGNAGSVNINARETVSVDGIVFNTVGQTAIGNTGGINITTGSLALTRESRLLASTDGQGDAGSVNINARDVVSLDGSAVFNTVGQTGVGNTGGINITTGSLALTRGSRLLASTDGQGDAGSANINARDVVSLDGSAVFNTVGQTGVGNTGGINITTGSLALTRGSQLLASTDGQGNAGSVNINARETVSVDGEAAGGTVASTIFTRVNPGALGQGGNVTISTGTLFLTNGGAVNTANVGGTGNAGRVTIQARDSVQIRGTAPILTVNRSGVFTSATPGSIGNGGEVSITAGSLSVSDQGRIITNAEGQGNAGRIQVQASDAVLFDGGDAISTLLSTGTGRGGDIDITARSLSLLNGAQLSASTSGDGNAGNITVSTDAVSLSRSGQLSTTTSSNGRAGDITVRTPDLQLAGATSGLFAGTTSPGDAGNLTIQSRGDGQSLRVNLQDGAQISASTSSSGHGGQLTITAPESITLTGNGSIISAGTGGGGTGGDLRLQTNTLSVQNQAGVTVSSSGTGNAGSLFVDANRVVVNNGGSIRAGTSSSGRGGQLTITAPESITLTGNGSIISAETGGGGTGGDLRLQTNTLSVQNQAGVTVSSSDTGNAGSLFVDANRVVVNNGGSIRADTSSSGQGGQLTITAPESITLTGNGSVITAGTGGSGAGGNLNLRTGTLNIQDQAEVTVSSTSTGSAGSLFVNADRLFLSNQGSIRADTTGGGGNINLRSPFILLRNGSNITTNAKGSNIPGGNIAIDTRFLLAVLSEDSNISANSEDFRGGNVSINAFSIFGIQPSLISTPLSDITATGATSALNGTLNVITTGIDPTPVVPLPTNLVDPAPIAQGCAANQGNSFIVSGRGGLPPTPEQQLDDDAEWQDRRRLVVAAQLTPARSNSNTQQPNSKTPSPILEATGWQQTPTGIVLIATTPKPTVQNLLNQPVACPGRR